MLSEIYLFILAKPNEAAGKTIKQIAALVNADRNKLSQPEALINIDKLRAARVKERTEWRAVKADGKAPAEHRARAKKMITELDGLIK